MAKQSRCRFGDLRSRDGSKSRQLVDKMLVAAVASGASIVMDDADWASLRKAAKAAVYKSKTKKLK